MCARATTEHRESSQSVSVRSGWRPSSSSLLGTFSLVSPHADPSRRLEFTRSQTSTFPAAQHGSRVSADHMTPTQIKPSLRYQTHHRKPQTSSSKYNLRQKRPGSPPAARRTGTGPDPHSRPAGSSALIMESFQNVIDADQDGINILCRTRSPE